MMLLSNLSACRACGSSHLRLGLDLGRLPLANSFLSRQRAMDATPDPLYPLRVFRCENCGLIQLLDVVDKKEMFDDYVFLTSTARTTVLHFDRYAEELTKRLSLNSEDLVVDIGSNDGTLLKAFKQRGTRVLGIEPAHNLAIRATKEGIPTLNEYLGPETVERIGRSQSRLVTANNVVSHVNDLNGFMKTVSMLLAPQGLFAFEVPWVVDVMHNYNFDIIYHEHLSYFGFKPLARVLESHNLELIDLQQFPEIHGGTLRGLASHTDAFAKRSDVLKKAFLNEERGASFQALEQFANQVYSIKTRLSEMLHRLKKEGKKIVGYGAPAKATILLNYCSIDRSVLDFVTDTTPLKQGRFVPGVRIPIVSPNELGKSRPDYALLLAWNFKDEILKKEQEYLRSGGQFIIPFPEPSILGQNSR